VGRTLAERQAQLEFYSLTGQRLPLERWPGPRALRGDFFQGEIAEVRFCSSGERRFFRMTTAPIHEAGATAGALLVFSDVTDEMNFERLKRDFLAELAHELRTPVTITKLGAQSVAGARDLPPTLRPRMEAITRAAARMGRVVDDIVEISCIMLGDLVLDRHRVELGALVRNVVAAAGRSARSRRLHVEVAEPLYVLADEKRLAHALRHLVDNALRYAPTGDVHVRVRRAEQGAEVCVEDQGIGIPEEKLPHLFELFFRGHAGTPDDVGGMGIGLFLCRELLRLHGGTVSVRSTVGQGSTFCVWLPVEEVH
jgi:signal transduction histidine kinase